MITTTEGDLWHWQLETMTELTKFIRAHGPGLPGALPAVSWQINAGVIHSYVAGGSVRCGAADDTATMIWADVNCPKCLALIADLNQSGGQ